MSAAKGLSDKAQAYAMIVASASLSVGTYLSISTADPKYIIFGGVLSAAAVGIKEALGVQPQTPK